MGDTWAFYESIGDSDRTEFSGVERAVAAVGDVRQEVNAGGPDS